MLDTTSPYYVNQLSYPDLPYPTTLELGEELAEPYPSVAVAGCGLCCMAMVLAALGQGRRTMEEMIALSVQAGANVYGTDMPRLCDFFSRQGLFSLHTGDEPEALLSHLKEGRPAILHVARPEGLFSDAGHYVMAAGMAGEDVYVLDPSATEEKYQKPYRRGRVRREGVWVVTDARSLTEQLGERTPAYYLFTGGEQAPADGT